MTHTKDEALRLALEALETLVNGNGFAPAGNIEKARKAITAIKQALSDATHLADSAIDRMAENARALGLDYEPVGWWDSKIGFFEEKHFDQLQPLYTASPASQRQWVGLAEADKHKPDMGAYVYLNDDWLDGYKTGMEYAEAKLKEKNNGN